MTVNYGDKVFAIVCATLCAYVWATVGQQCGRTRQAENFAGQASGRDRSVLTAADLVSIQPQGLPGQPVG